MKRVIWLWQLFGFAFTVLGGTLLHFLYDLTGGAVWAAVFSGVNESTAEHMKLLFWPTFIFAVVQSLFFGGYGNFWCVKLRGMLVGLISIPIIFYTYNGVIGKSPDWVNIAIFFISAAMAYAYEARELKRGDAVCKSPRAAFIALCVIGLLFTLFTFVTPALEIFRDPVSVAYGI